MNSRELNNLIDSQMLICVSNLKMGSMCGAATTGIDAHGDVTTGAVDLFGSASNRQADPRSNTALNPDARAHLKNITHIYTDLDGTLLAPGGRLLANHVGKPSTATAEALVALKDAGIEVIVATGRSGMEADEHMRLLNIDTYISEVGCMIQNGVRAKAKIKYLLGEWSNTIIAQGLAVGELPANKTPYEIMLESGVLDRLVTAFPGKLESLHNLINPRSVTHALQGYIDLHQAQALLSLERLPLQLIDNGVIHPQMHGLIDCPEIHIYHLMPKGTSKAQGVAFDIESHATLRSQTLAIGDSVEDLGMSDAVGTMVIMGNALTSPTVQEVLTLRASRGQPTLYTALSTADGWVEFARSLVTAKEA